jgi:hypothetical protein
VYITFVLPRVFGIVTGRFGHTHDERPVSETGRFAVPATGVRPAANELEVIAAWKLDEAEYGNASLDLDLLLHWWSVYPRGFWLAFEDGAPVGSLGLWPIRRAAFHDIATGRRAEKQLKGADFAPVSDARWTKSWYCSGIVVARAARRRRSAAARRLVRGTLEGWAAPLSTTIDLCAVTFTPEGRRLARRIGMVEQRPSGFSVQEYPVYVALDKRPSALAARFSRARI